jgi:hypothetical protein
MITHLPIHFQPWLNHHRKDHGSIITTTTTTTIIIIIIIIQFNSILIYLRANLTAQRPITKSARVTRKNKIQNMEVYTVMITIPITKLKVTIIIILIIIIIIIIIISLLLLLNPYVVESVASNLFMYNC